jgi:hypothetical protein
MILMIRDDKIDILSKEFKKRVIEIEHEEANELSSRSDVVIIDRLQREFEILVKNSEN